MNATEPFEARDYATDLELEELGPDRILTFRGEKMARAEWFTDRAEAIAAAAG